MRPYAAVCFDFDYTLGDCTDAIEAGFVHGLTQLGWPAPSREAVRRTIGYKLEDAYTLLTGDTDPERVRAFRPLFVAVAHQRQAEEAVPFPGAIALLRGLRRAGVPAGIVSTKKGDVIQQIAHRWGVEDDLALIIGGELVAKPKPDPAGLHLALDRLGAAPEQLLFCGDTVLDAGAAQNAGCPFCAVLNGTTPAEDFAPFRPVHIAPDLLELAKWLEIEI